MSLPQTIAAAASPNAIVVDSYGLDRDGASLRRIAQVALIRWSGLRPM